MHYRLKCDLSIFNNDSSATISDQDLLGPFQQLLIFLTTKLSIQFSQGWRYECAAKSICIYMTEFLPKIGVSVKYSLVINARKIVTIVANGKVLSMKPCNWIKDSTLRTWEDLIKLMNYLDSGAAFDLDASSCVEKSVEILKSFEFPEEKQEQKKKLIVNQLENFTKPAPQCWRFSIDTLLMAFYLRNISTACYAVMSSFFCLPSIRKLRNMSQGFNVMDNMKYFEEFIVKMTPLQRVISISIDEIYLKESSDYKDGKMHGFAEVR